MTTDEMDKHAKLAMSKMNRKMLELMYSTNPYIDELFNKTEEVISKQTICECGAIKAKTTHAHWCPCWKEF